MAKSTAPPAPGEGEELSLDDAVRVGPDVAPGDGDPAEPVEVAGSSSMEGVDWVEGARMQEDEGPIVPEAPPNPTLEGVLKTQHGPHGRLKVSASGGEPGPTTSELDALDKSALLMRRVKDGVDEGPSTASSRLNYLGNPTSAGGRGAGSIATGGRMSADDGPAAPSTMNPFRGGPNRAPGSFSDESTDDDDTDVGGLLLDDRAGRLRMDGGHATPPPAGKSGLNSVMDVPRLSAADVASARKEAALAAERSRKGPVPPAPVVPKPAGGTDHAELPEVELASELADDQRPPKGDVRWVGSRTEVRIEYRYWRFERVRIQRDRFDSPEDPTWPVTEARLPAFANPRGRLANGLLAQAAVLHYVDGMPLNQLASVLGARGATHEPAGLGAELKRAGELLEPIYDHLLAKVHGAPAKSRTLDPAPVPVRLTVGRRAVPGHLRGGQVGDVVVFAVALGGSGDALGGTAGVGTRKPGLARAAHRAAEGWSRDGRWAQVRRRLFQALPTTPDRARRGLSLAEVVSVASGQGWGEPGGEAADAVDRFGAWLDAETEGLTDPKLPLEYALQYIVSTWSRLLPFDQRGAPTDDVAAPGRAGQRVPEWRFTGEDGGVRTAAVFLSLAASCRRSGHYPQRYLADALGALAAAPARDPKAFTPAAWAERQV